MHHKLIELLDFLCIMGIGNKWLVGGIWRFLEHNYVYIFFFTFLKVNCFSVINCFSWFYIHVIYCINWIMDFFFFLVLILILIFWAKIYTVNFCMGFSILYFAKLYELSHQRKQWYSHTIISLFTDYVSHQFFRPIPISNITGVFFTIVQMSCMHA